MDGAAPGVVPLLSGSFRGEGGRGAHHLVSGSWKPHEGAVGGANDTIPHPKITGGGGVGHQRTGRRGLSGEGFPKVRSVWGASKGGKTPSHVHTDVWRLLPPPIDHEGASCRRWAVRAGGGAVEEGGVLQHKGLLGPGLDRDPVGPGTGGREERPSRPSLRGTEHHGCKRLGCCVFGQCALMYP